jgi:hypothetical protein
MQQNQLRLLGPPVDCDYPIAQQKLQHMKWPDWMRDEQIKNSDGMDKDSATSGKLSIPQYCCLKLKLK